MWWCYVDDGTSLSKHQMVAAVTGMSAIAFELLFKKAKYVSNINRKQMIPRILEIGKRVLTKGLPAHIYFLLLINVIWVTLLPRGGGD